MLNTKRHKDRDSQSNCKHGSRTNASDFSDTNYTSLCPNLTIFQQFYIHRIEIYNLILNRIVIKYPNDFVLVVFTVNEFRINILRLTRRLNQPDRKCISLWFNCTLHRQLRVFVTTCSPEITNLQ